MQLEEDLARLKEHATIDGHVEPRPETVALAKRLNRASPKTGERLSYRKISARLEKAGSLNERGQPYNPKSVRSMVG